MKNRIYTKGAIVRFLSAVLVTSLMLSLFAGCGYKEGDDAKVYKKLTSLLTDGDYESANKLVQENPWYQITDVNQASAVIEGIQKDRLHSYYWLPVIDTIACTDSTFVADLDAYLHNDALRWLDLSGTGFDDERVKDVWSRCSEGSAGKNCLNGFTQIFEGDPEVGANMLKPHLDADERWKETIQYRFQTYLGEREYAGVQDYMDQMMAFAILYGDHHAADLRSFVLPHDGARPHDRLHEKEYGDIYVYASILTYEDLAANLPNALSGAHGNKVLVLDRVAFAGTDEVKLGIDSFMMHSLPEKYMPETLDEVGYVMLIDYGLEKEGIWYAGNAKVTVYNAATGTEIYASEKMVGTYDQFYFGKSTDVIFGSYPDITEAVRRAMESIDG